MVKAAWGRVVLEAAPTAATTRLYLAGALRLHGRAGAVAGRAVAVRGCVRRRRSGARGGGVLRPGVGRGLRMPVAFAARLPVLLLLIAPAHRGTGMLRMRRAHVLG